MCGSRWRAPLVFWRARPGPVGRPRREISWPSPGSPRFLSHADPVGALRPRVPPARPTGAGEAVVGVPRAGAEPSRWMGLHFEGWCSLTANRLAAWDAGEPLVQVTRALQAATADTTTFEHWTDTLGDDPASGLWFL